MRRERSGEMVRETRRVKRAAAAKARPRAPGPPPRPKLAQARSRANPRLSGGVGRWLTTLLLVALLAPLALAAVYRVVAPPITLLMVERLAQGYGLHKDWRPVSRISPDLVRSVIAAEDAHFCSHHGFDIAALRAAAAHNARDPHRVRGGSTISQQTAKNVFLWPQRSYVRKGLEAGFTSLIEALWGKRRIMELYLNVVEWGPGVYGAQAASQRYFGHGADELSPQEAARLAAILPDPLKWKAVQPGAYVMRRSRRIGAAAQTVRADDLAACVLRGSQGSGTAEDRL